MRLVEPSAKELTIRVVATPGFLGFAVIFLRFFVIMLIPDCCLMWPIDFVILKNDVRIMCKKGGEVWLGVLFYCGEVYVPSLTSTSSSATRPCASR
jgi:hypothetical protein